ncbi:MAG: sulfurtransferase TusA family protein [Leptolyngbya sp. SIO1E4]|nr:sulfurtransferase TusA family protein [Leptolyngbya sp. SIO1E4]
MSDSTAPLSSEPISGSQVEPDTLLDLRGTPCPINFVRTKLQLQRMEPGTLLEVWIDPGEPVAQVPDSLRMEGYGIEQLMDQGTYYALQVRNSLS